MKYRYADEYETSLYLVLRPELVEMDKAVVDEPTPLPASFQIDLLAGTHPEGAAGHFTPYWSAQTTSDVMGDATKASVEKGETFLSAAIEGLIDLIQEMRETPIPQRRDQH